MKLLSTAQCSLSDDVALAYLTDQLIAYIGNKRKLLGLIRQAIQQTGLTGGVFFDMFAGSGSVSRLAKHVGFRVIANDWEPYTRFINGAYIATNQPPAFKAFGGMEQAVRHLNALPGHRGYIATHYCPCDDEAPDLDSERMFFTQENGQRLDAMREEVETLWLSGALTEDEYTVLVAALVWGASWCSNTSGVFKGFHRGWGGATKTAWYRIKARLEIRPPILLDNGQKNMVYQQDAQTLAPEVECDIAYLDPPYNQHQYGANYHFLNTMALWDKPEISPRFDPATIGFKSAIRHDWRTARRSAYCSRQKAEAELTLLLASLRAKWVLMSYSTDGMIPLENLTRLLSTHGRLTWVQKDYKRYRVSTQRPSAQAFTSEFVLILEMGER